SPEAADGGPIGLVRDGDLIEIDIPNRTLSVKVAEEELEKRRGGMVPHEPKIKTGYMSKYAVLASSADTGAVLRW
ncbi:MAG TPA: dihydroxy-acid dehydratase, partial [Planctomycetaceae bacterium]|nr:dihydroxy-acid dehydratase [Planctomycetaceae bacterium]